MVFFSSSLSAVVVLPCLTETVMHHMANIEVKTGCHHTEILTEKNISIPIMRVPEQAGGINNELICAEIKQQKITSNAPSLRNGQRQLFYNGFLHLKNGVLYLVCCHENGYEEQQYDKLMPDDVKRRAAIKKFLRDMSGLSF